MQTLPYMFAPNPHMLTAQSRVLEVALELIELDQRLYEIAEGLPIPPTFVGMEEGLHWTIQGRESTGFEARTRRCFLGERHGRRNDPDANHDLGRERLFPLIG